MICMSLVSAAFVFLCLGASSAAPVINDHSVIEYCDDGSSQECAFQSVNMNECTALNNANNARWTSAQNGCWLYDNGDCSGEERISLPIAMTPFVIKIPMRGNAVYCTSESRSG